MNRTQFSKTLVPGLFSMAVEAYEPRAGKEEWRQLVEACGAIRTSKRAYEDAAYFAGLGNVPVKGEGEPIAYDDMVQGPTKRWNHVTRGLGIRITEEMIEDCLYPEVPTEMSDLFRELGMSAKETLNLLVFDIFNSGTGTSSHTGGDGLAIFSGSHTQLRGGTWSNLLSPAADLSATTLQTSLDNFENQKDDTGKYMRLKARYILGNPSSEWKIRELLDSQYDPESNNNAVNVLSSRSLKPMITPYYNDTDAFTLLAEPPHSKAGLIAFERRKVTFAKDGDFDTGDFKAKTTFRFSSEINKAINLYHSAGA